MTSGLRISPARSSTVRRSTGRLRNRLPTSPAVSFSISFGCWRRSPIFIVGRVRGNDPNASSRQEDPLSVERGPTLLDGKYQIEGSLGHGGMGFVYRARHVELGKTFAVKLVQPHKAHRSEYLARFRIEAQALGKLSHPNIVQVTDYGVDPKAGPYLVMEYIDGITLSEYIKQRRALPLDEALPIFSSISRALDYAHDCGVLHRDLKPANVLLFRNETSDHDAKIVDFGIALFWTLLAHSNLPPSLRQRSNYAGRSLHWPLTIQGFSRGQRIPSRRPQD